MSVLEFIFGYIKIAQITDLIDILLVSYLIYFVLKKIKGTIAERLLKGVALLLITLLFSSIFKLNTINYILENVMQIGLIALAIVFQPELRQILEKIGKTTIYKNNGSEELTEGEIIINEICDACDRLSKAKEGGLIVFERENSLKEVISSGVKLNAKVSSELLRNIFYPKAPLHDGSVVITKGKIESASCILPLSKNQNISKDLGTRHRAGVGISEITDALCIIISEETGSISLANKGMLKRHLSYDILKKMLYYELIKKENKEQQKNFVDSMASFIDKIIDFFKPKEEEE